MVDIVLKPTFCTLAYFSLRRIQQIDKNVKRSMQKDKRQWLDNLAEEAETSANNET
jgi:hypothetical protein